MIVSLKVNFESNLLSFCGLMISFDTYWFSLRFPVPFRNFREIFDSLNQNVMNYFLSFCVFVYEN